ncbi:hypothetical protein [Streptomyces cavernicola]|uniref:Uncharacterized protein n=1 Tax=Streptomyces cavernicola TaxID=3043613 RepID=A0ABT6S871_9ACTN|nr:hypothetical protein [Streptomyces sp. B-S-A6]MDI3404301.1 hypothetical protein [Streptomyces sp. B-S-A6]
MIGAHLGVALLHALRDSMHGITLWLVVMLTTSHAGLVVITLLALAWARSLARRDPTWRSTP